MECDTQHSYSQGNEIEKTKSGSFSGKQIYGYRRKSITNKLHAESLTWRKNSQRVSAVVVPVKAEKRRKTDERQVFSYDNAERVVVVGRTMPSARKT